MKASELRIGNLVFAEIGIGLPQVHEVQAADIEAINLNKVEVFHIPLTEEWLLNLGFIKGEKYFSFNGFDIDDKGWIGFNNMVADCKIKYVHQLQNLYFALTGEELTIKTT